MSNQPSIDAIMRIAPVIPVLVVDDVAAAAQMARDFVAAGLPVIEITLRTPAALDVISEMANVEGALVGAGTVLTERQLDDAARAGARFVVSPGLTATVVNHARRSSLPILPGVATAGDIMRGLDLGLDRFKFFPAMAAGGLPALSALSEPFRSVRFCPTGGISQRTALEWLSHPNVLCVGGSWLAAGSAIDPALARAASRLRSAAKQPDGSAGRKNHSRIESIPDVQLLGATLTKLVSAQ